MQIYNAQCVGKSALNEGMTDIELKRRQHIQVAIAAHIQKLCSSWLRYLLLLLHMFSVNIFKVLVIKRALL